MCHSWAPWCIFGWFGTAHERRDYYNTCQTGWCVSAPFASWLIPFQTHPYLVYLSNQNPKSKEVLETFSQSTNQVIPGRLRTYKVVITDPKSTLNGLEGLIPWSTSRSSACTKTTKMPCENHVFLTGWRRVSYATRCIVQGRALPLSDGLRPIEAVHTVLIGTCRLSVHRIPTLVDFITFFWLGPFLQPVALYGLLQLRISQSLQQYAGLHSF